MSRLAGALVLALATTSCFAADTRVAPKVPRARDLNMIVDADGSGKASLIFQTGSEANDTFKVVYNAAEADVLNVKTAGGKSLFKILGKSGGAGKTNSIVLKPDAPANATAATVLLEENTRHAQRLRRAKNLARRLLQVEGAADAALAAAKALPEVAAPASNRSYSRMVTAPAGRLTSTGKIVSSEHGKVTVQGESQWRMIAEEDFVKGGVQDWRSASENVSVSDQVTTCAKHPHGNSDYFLGAFSNVRVMKTFQLPFHEFIRVTARVHFLDMWEGEAVYMKTNGGVKWSKSHRWCTEFPQKKCEPSSIIDNGALDTCGDPNFSDSLSQPVDVIFRTEGKGAVTLEFGGLLTTGQKCTGKSDCDKNSFECVEGMCTNTKATWGVDDVRIFIK
eukprot:g1262.t1